MPLCHRGSAPSIRIAKTKDHFQIARHEAFLYHQECRERITTPIVIRLSAANSGRDFMCEYTVHVALRGGTPRATSLKNLVRMVHQSVGKYAVRVDFGGRAPRSTLFARGGTPCTTRKRHARDIQPYHPV